MTANEPRDEDLIENFLLSVDDDHDDDEFFLSMKEEEGRRNSGRNKIYEKLELARAQYIKRNPNRKRGGAVEKRSSVCLDRDLYNDKQEEEARDDQAVTEAATAATVDADKIQGSSTLRMMVKEKSVSKSSFATSSTYRSSFDGSSSQSSTRTHCKAELTALGPYAFTMQLLRQLRDKDHRARGSLSTHSEASVEQGTGDDGRLSRKKEEAEEALKAFKAADLHEKYEVANNFKNLYLEGKQKKKVALDHNKGYRKRG